MGRIKRKNRVVLFLPSTSEDRQLYPQKLPLEILSLAGLLVNQSYPVILIDGSIRERYVDEVINACEEALCLGISCSFGYQVYAAATMAQLIKERFPELPVVLGGWFPSVKPELFLKEGLADIVVRGQGEETFFELVESLRQKTSLENIQGITYKKERQMINNPDRPLVKLDDLPPIPYHLISDDLEGYIKSDQNCEDYRYLLTGATGISHMNCELRILWYYTSYGCSDNCSFCCSPGVTQRRWVTKDPVKAVDEIESLVKQYSYNVLYLIDANFCLNEKRMIKFCEEIIKRGINIKWEATAEQHSIVHYGEDTLALMAESGCFCLFLGAETACAKTMDMLNKNIKVGDTQKCVAILVKHKIIPELSYVIGLPDESPESIEETIGEWLDLKFKYPAIKVMLHYFVPFPGIRLYSRSLQLGYEEPKFPMGYKELPLYPFGSPIITDWVRKAQVLKINRYRYTYLKWAYDILREKPRLNFFQKVLNKSALFRIKHKISVLPIEFWLYEYAGRMVHQLTPFRP